MPANAHPLNTYVDGPHPDVLAVRRDVGDDARSNYGAPVARLHDIETAPYNEAEADERFARPSTPAREAPRPAIRLEREEPPVAEATEAPRALPAHETADHAHAAPYRLTFRLSVDQRRRLRIAAAKKDVSLQAVVSEALDAHLDSLCACSLSDCACMAREGAD